MPVGRRGVVAGLLLAVALAACGPLDGDRDVADCDVVRVAFDDALWRVGEDALLPADGEEEEEVPPPVGDPESLRRALDLHDTRGDCFEDDIGEFLDPARDLLDEGFEDEALPGMD